MPDDSDVSGEAGAPRGRDFWDKAQAIAGLATAVLVALVGGLFTYVYNPVATVGAATLAWQPASPTTGQTVHFDGTSSSCSSSPCTYTWQDDGSDGPGGTNWPLGTGVTLDFTFQGTGTKYVRLTVRDNRNRASTVEHDVVVGSAPPPSGCAQQPFCGDFETGNVSQWPFEPLEGTGSITVGTSASQPVKQGTYSAKFVTTAGTGTARAELNASQAQTGGYPGQEWYYGWWSYFPSINGQPQQWWSNGGDWNDIVQFQSVDWTAWMYLGVDQGNYTPGSTSIFLNWGDAGPSRRHLIVANPIQYDHWYHFVLHAKWSIDPAVGFIELDVDGVNVIPRTMGPTLYGTTVTHNPADTAPGSYAELDLYHGATSFTNTVIHDGFCRAATYTDAAAC
ncbi:MAG: heparin lyase I family protein [Solirubrobacteraceae bacterium]